MRLRLGGIVLALVLVLPAGASAACGTPKRAYPSKAAWHRPYRPALVIGDSVMLNAVDALARKGFQVNARGCRMWREGLQLLRARRRRLPHFVVMALGSNWNITRADIERTLTVIGRKRVLGLVVPRETGGGVSADAYHVRRAGRRHRNRVKVIDWVAASRGHGNWFAGDGLHLSWSGVRAYSNLIARYRRWARPEGRSRARPARARSCARRSPRASRCCPG